MARALAAKQPVYRKFREALLAQGSRLFAQPRPGGPAGGAAQDRARPGSQDRAFEWELGTTHSRGLYRAGSDFPYGWRGTGMRTRAWSHTLDARQTWPLSFRERAVNLSLAGNQDFAPDGGPRAYAAAFQADMPQAILDAFSLSLSAGIGRTEPMGPYRSLALQAGRDWDFENLGADFQWGLSGYWDNQGRRGEGGTWAILGRDFGFAHGPSVRLSLLGEADQESPTRDRITAPVLYVDDVSKPRPTHFRGPDFSEPLPPFSPISYDLYAVNTGKKDLSLQAPQSSFSLRPSLGSGFDLPGGWQSHAELGYGLVFYPEYAWDQVPLPASGGTDSATLAGLALNRADGRYYAAFLERQAFGYREAYGTAPLERRKMRRVDQNVSLDFSMQRMLPQGYALIFEASSAFAWSNLPGLSPAGFQPRQFGLGLKLSHASAW